MCYNSRVSGCGRFFGCAVRQKFRGVPEMKEAFKEIEITVIMLEAEDVITDSPIILPDDPITP